MSNETIGTKTPVETNGVAVVATKTRTHPKLGEYKNVRVEWKQPHKSNLEIFVGINDYTTQFKPEITVSIPEGAIKFLKTSTYEEHYFDNETKLHATRPKAKYFVELVVDDEE